MERCHVAHAKEKDSEFSKELQGSALIAKEPEDEKKTIFHVMVAVDWAEWAGLIINGVNYYETW